MPARYDDEALREALQIDDPLQRTRCPGCGYFHTQGTPRCALCAEGAPIINSQASGTYSVSPEERHAAALALLDGDYAALPAASLEAHVPVAFPAPDAEVGTPEDARALPLPRLRPKCLACQCVDHEALNRDCEDPLQTQRAIAARYAVSLHSLTQHRRVCLGLPLFNKQESGARRQSLRRHARQNEPKPLCASFLACVRQELATIPQALAPLEHRIEALQSQHRKLTAQAQCLREYLDLTERTQ